jgi:hypothetical protein
LVVNALDKGGFKACIAELGGYGGFCFFAEFCEFFDGDVVGGDDGFVGDFAVGGVHFGMINE